MKSGYQIRPRGLSRMAELQWQPTLRVHDPNPPITIEHNVTLTPDAVAIPFLVPDPTLTVAAGGAKVQVVVIA